MPAQPPSSDCSRSFRLRSARRFKKRPARVLHIGPLGLDEPGVGLPGLPERLAQFHATVAYTAVERLFDAAIENKVDAVLLSGGVPDPSRFGLRPLVFVYERCRTLIDHRIPVVIAGDDPAVTLSGCSHLRAPRNVFFLPEASERVVTIGDPRRRRRLDIGSIAIDSDARMRIAMSTSAGFADGVATPDDGRRGAVIAPGLARAEYIALGSSRTFGACATINPGRRVWQAGCPQSRHFDESGPAGAVLVSLGRKKQPTVERLIRDVVRYHTVCIETTDGTTRNNLNRQLRFHTERLHNDRDVNLHVLRWQVVGHGSAWESLQSEVEAGRWLTTARGEMTATTGDALVWPASVDVIADETQRQRDAAIGSSFGRFVRALQTIPPSRADAAIAAVRPLLA